MSSSFSWVTIGKTSALSRIRNRSHGRLGRSRHRSRQTGHCDAKWNSGWQRQGRIDEKNHVWYAAARVPLRSVSEKQVSAGTKWRANLYRIDGLGCRPGAPLYVLASDVRRPTAIPITCPNILEL